MTGKIHPINLAKMLVLSYLGLNPKWLLKGKVLILAMIVVYAGQAILASWISGGDLKAV